jgi:hypothetical protein
MDDTEVAHVEIIARRPRGRPFGRGLVILVALAGAGVVAAMLRRRFTAR